MQQIVTMPGARILVASAAVVALLLVGCRHYPGPALAPAALVAGGPHQNVLVERRDGSHVVLERASVLGDTLFGTGRVAGRGGGYGPLALPIAELAEVRIGRVSAGRTAALAVGVTAAVLGVFVAVLMTSTLQ